MCSSRCAPAVQGKFNTNNCQADMPALSSPTSPADQPGQPVAEPAAAACPDAGQPALPSAQHSTEADEPCAECITLGQGMDCPDASRPEAPPPATHAGVPAARRPAAAQDAACFEVSLPAMSQAELGSAAAGMPPAAHPAAELAAACPSGSQPASSPAETAPTSATVPAAEQPTPQLDAARPDASQRTPSTLQQETATADNRVRVRITSGWPPLALSPALAEAQLRTQARLLACWPSFWPQCCILVASSKPCEAQPE